MGMSPCPSSVLSPALPLPRTISRFPPALVLHPFSPFVKTLSLCSWALLAVNCFPQSNLATRWSLTSTALCSPEPFLAIDGSVSNHLPSRTPSYSSGGKHERAAVEWLRALSWQQHGSGPSVYEVRRSAAAAAAAATWYSSLLGMCSKGHHKGLCHNIGASPSAK